MIRSPMPSERSTARLRMPMPSSRTSSTTQSSSERNQIVIRCQGPRVQIWINGLATVDYTEKDDAIARRGIIGLQIHGGEPAEASYRKIRIKAL